MSKNQLDKFHFRNLHPQILIGTASDRYAGWLGQIYSPDRYQGKIAKRTKIIAGKSFIEEVLSVDSVAEYFEHFPVLEIDFIFYRPLLDPNGQTNQNYQVLKNYAKHLKEGDRIILKVPQMVMAQKIRKGDYHVANPAYLNPKIFTEQFYEPTINLLGHRRSRMRESRPSGSVRAKAEWLSYSTRNSYVCGLISVDAFSRFHQRQK